MDQERRQGSVSVREKISSIFDFFNSFSIISLHNSSHTVRLKSLFLILFSVIGMCDFEPYVRAECGVVLRSLVPLAPLARERTRQNKLKTVQSSTQKIGGSESKGEGRLSSLIDSILSRHSPPRITESEDTYDVRTMKILKNRCVQSLFILCFNFSSQLFSPSRPMSNG